MDEDEIFVFAIAIGLALFMFFSSGVSGFHRLFLRGNPAVGVARLSVAAAMIWIGIVIWLFADPSVQGIYILFYLVMGYGVVKFFGQKCGQLFGPRLKVDVYQRKNMAAAVFLGAFTLATGMIFGGSLWGEADPVGEDEGGWWIPLGFFIMGWLVLVLALVLYIRPEPAGLRMKLSQNRDLADARACATFLLSSAALITDAVAGDFFGWTHGLISLAGVVVLLVAHQLLMPRDPLATATTTVDRGKYQKKTRLGEVAAYISLAVFFWVLTRLIQLVERAVQ